MVDGPAKQEEQRQYHQQGPHHGKAREYQQEVGAAALMPTAEPGGGPLCTPPGSQLSWAG